jgi:glycosyltransferase involved in cell wall biosynthesis
MITDDAGFKIKVLEAMAMRKPIVSTSLGAKGINIVDGKNIIIANKPDEFARSVVDLLNDERQRYNMGLKARKTAENSYSWHIMSERLCNVLEKVAQNNNLYLPKEIMHHRQIR